jgi:RNA ligase (TIGR02306 family)
MRELATIQKISDLQPIENADRIEVASILGWKVVVKKNEFQLQDLCVYCEIDSVLPPKPEFSFLEKSKYRIKTVKMRGQISQGICFPLSILPKDEYNIGDNVTELLDVKKYEQPEKKYCEKRKGNFPLCVPKTNEIRIQSKPRLLNELRGAQCYATYKIDGTSATFVKNNGQIDVCSRNLSVEEEEESIYWRMFHKYIVNAFNELDNVAIQGEIAGPGIQKNRLKLSEIDLFVFNVFDVKHQKYYDFAEFVRFCRNWNLKHVPISNISFFLNHTIDDLLEMAKGQYQNGGHREGIVIRPVKERYSHALQKRASFKVINNEFLLGHNE